MSYQVRSLQPLPYYGLSNPPTQEAIHRAKGDFLFFVKGENFERVSGGTLPEFRKALVRIYQVANNRADSAWNHSGRLFTEIIQQAEQDGSMPESVRDVFYNENVNQAAFADEISP